ncbi:hypothetical protein SERLA73DRAFT_71588 [Serpula lacrymans var. lacrymans S7.3]|uniref:SH3 domain-containing protein n=1 Tax=Serpula lacrymans var. lacrymans (strain S7.3) TaxID=936435 RepID=F8PRF4_SERL3|nr:hypothetical protein SERLA73DRAFT_71588 [Serpula lacrymans var. lacrymans S7.3]
MSARRQSSTTSLAKYARANSPDLSHRSLDFCNAFWGIGDGGVDVLFARMRGASRTMDELRAFWKERSAIEEEYAKKLAKLAKVAMGKDEIGLFRVPHPSPDDARVFVQEGISSYRNSGVNRLCRTFCLAHACTAADAACTLQTMFSIPIGLSNHDDHRELRNSLDTLRLETDKQAACHLQLGQQIRTDLEGQASAFFAKQTHHKKNFQATIEKEFKVKQTREQHANKAREKYESDCLRINSYTAQSTLVQGKDLEKIHLKLERAQQTVQVNGNDYSQFTRVYQETAQKWEQDWKAFCDSCQDLEEERMEFMKDNMWAYANAVSTVCVSDDESCEKMRLALEQMEPDKDMENFVRDYGTGNAVPEPPAFVNYANTDAPPPSANRISTRPASYTRSSQRAANPRNAPPPPEEEPQDNRAGVGAGGGGGGGGARDVPPEATLARSQTQVYQNGRSPTNATESANVNGSSRSPQPDVMRRASTRGRPKSTHDPRGVDPIDPTVNSTMLVVGNAAYSVDPNNDPQQQKGTQVRTSPPIGEQGDPLVQKMAELTSAASGTTRRQSMRNPPPGAGQGPMRKGTFEGSSLNTPSPSNGGRVDPQQGYRNSAEIVVGSYPMASSRPTSPNPPTAVMSAPPQQILPPTATNLPVESVVNNYQRPFPGEARSRSNSYRASITGPPPTAAPTQEQNGVRPTSRQGYAGIGAQPVSRSVSPANQPAPYVYHPPPPNQPVRAPSISQRPVTPNPVGIILGPDGSVHHDSMYTNNVPQQYGAPGQGQQNRDPRYHPMNQPQRPSYDNGPTTQPPANYASRTVYVPPPPHVGYDPPPPSSGGHYAPPQPAPNQYNAPPQAAYGHQPVRSYNTAVTQPPPNNMYHYGNNAYRAPSPARSPSPQPPRQAAPPTGTYTDDGRPILFYVKALYDYSATIEEEFDFQAGDIIAVTDTPEDGWWSGELLDEARRQTGRHVFPTLVFAASTIICTWLFHSRAIVFYRITSSSTYPPSLIMRPYAIYEHPDFIVPSKEDTSTLQKVAYALTIVAASGAAMYEIAVHSGVA